MNSYQNPMPTNKKPSSVQKNKDGLVLILLENEVQVNDYLSWFDEIRGEKLIVALTPSAMYELDKHGLNYKVPDDYYDPVELYQIGFDNFKKVENLCNVIDAEIEHRHRDFIELAIKPAMFSYYHLKMIYDSITIRVFQLSKIMETEKVCTVYFYDSAKYPFGSSESAPYLFFNHMESLYSKLLLLDKWDITLKLLPHLPQYRNKAFKINNLNIAKINKNISTWLICHPKLYDFTLSIKKTGFIGSVRWLKKHSHQANDSPVILYGVGYNWDDCNEDLHAEGIAPVHRILDDFHWLDKAIKYDLDNLHTAWFRLQENPEFKTFFIIHNIDFFPLIEERLEFLVKQMSVACLIAVQDVMNLIETKNIKAVIASTLSTCVGHSTAQAAHNSKIPVITWQHGGYGAMEIHPLVNYCDLINSDVHFVFGDGVIDSYLKDAKKYGTELVAVGSSLLECINCRDKITRDDTTSNNRKNILYVTSSYMQNNFTISTFPAISDVLFWKMQKSIIDFLGNHDNHSITIKLHPSNDGHHPLQSYSVDQRYNHLKFIRREKSFSELIQTADVIVIDFPFTTILQALTIKKPIFVYTGCVHYNQNAHRLLSKRAICCSNLNEFLCKLDKYLIDNVYEADLNDNEFLIMYGIGSKESTPKKRAPKELKQIINKFNQTIMGNM